MMRGELLGLKGKDLVRYQAGEVIEVGVLLEGALTSWIEDEQIRQGRRAPIPKASFDLKKAMARRLAVTSGWSSPGELFAVRKAFKDAAKIMKLRNRVVHDQWEVFSPGKITRWGFFEATKPGDKDVDIFDGVGPGQFTHDDWELLRIDLWKMYHRLSRIRFVTPLPDGDTRGRAVDWEIVRGEFDLTALRMQLWSLKRTE